MARTRIKKGILEFSTIASTQKIVSEYFVEVRYTGNKMSHAYVLLGKKRNPNVDSK